MGACSSKPKTTEFDGSVAPAKHTDEVSVDHPQTMERSAQIPATEHGKEVPLKIGEGEGGDPALTTEAAKTEGAPDVGKGEGSVMVVTTSSAGSHPEALGQREADNEDEQKEKDGDSKADEVVQKDEVASAVTDSSIADSKRDDKRDVHTTVVDTPSAHEKGVEEKAVPDESEIKTCKDKAVVLEETGSSLDDAPYVDKTVAINEDNPAATEAESDTSDKRSIVVPDVGVSDVLGPTEIPGIESPIVGVVQPVEPTREDDVAKSLDIVPEKDRADVGVDVDAQDGFKLAQEGHSRNARDEDAHATSKAVDAGLYVDAPASLDLNKDVLEQAGEASSEAIEASNVEKLAPAEGDPFEVYEEAAPESQVEAASDEVNSVIPTTIDSRGRLEESSRDLEPSAPLEETVINGHSPKDGVTIEDLKIEAPKITESINSDVSTSQPVAGDAADEFVKEVHEPVTQETDVSNGKIQALATESSGEDGKLKGTVDESTSNNQVKSEGVRAITNDVQKGPIEKPIVEHATSGDLTFEDASDAPLKLEASKSMEEGQIPN